jgi:hypothetical protein
VRPRARAAFKPAIGFLREPVIVGSGWTSGRSGTDIAAGCDSNNSLNLRNILLFVAHDGSLSLSSQRKPFGLPLENLTPKLKHG